MFDLEARQSMQQGGGGQRFGHENQLWSNEPSEDSLAKIQRMSVLLAKRLGPEYLSTRQGPGGSKLTYLEGWRAISLANEVFGFNGWSSSVKDISIDFLDYNEEAQRWSVHVTALVRVTLPDGCYHEDVGCGKMDNCKSKADALDKVKKEAVTDGMKRALRNFGNLMGNCIYDKKFLDDISKVKAPGKGPLDFSTLHRPGQIYDADGKVIPAAVKAELNKAPVAGPSNAGQSIPNQGPQMFKKVEQQQHPGAPVIQQKVAPQVPRHQVPVQRPEPPPPQPQFHRQQANPAQQQQPPPRIFQNPGTVNAQQNQPANIQRQVVGTSGAPNNPQITKSLDPDQSLDSEGMYEGMEDFEEETEQQQEGAAKYDDSGFDEGNITIQIQAQHERPIQRQMPPNQNNQNAVAQQPPIRQAQPQGLPQQQQQLRQPQPVQNQSHQAARVAAPMQAIQTRPQQAVQQNQVHLKQEHQQVRVVQSAALQGHARRISGGGQPGVNGQVNNVQEDVEVAQQYLYAQSQPVRSQTRRASGQERVQGQGSSPFNQLQGGIPQVPGRDTGFVPPPNGMVVPESVSFRSSTRGVKRPLPTDDNRTAEGNAPVNPAVQQAQQGIQRAMSPSERARLAEEQALLQQQQQQMIAQNRQAAVEKRQRNNRSSGHKPVSA